MDLAPCRDVTILASTMLNETWGNHGKKSAKLSSRRLVLSWKSVWHSQSRQRLGRQWTALNLLSTWANRWALSTSSSRQSILGRYAPLFSCSKYVHFYGRLTVYSLYSSPYTLSKSTCFIDTLWQAQDSLQCLLASFRHQPSLGCGRKSAQIPRQRSKARQQKAFQTFPYDADYATCHDHSTSSTPNCQCG